MEVIIKHELKRIKNGWSARATDLGLTSHGHSEELAQRNLERGVRLFLSPFERVGSLKEELKRMKLTVLGDGEDIVVRLEP